MFFGFSFSTDQHDIFAMFIVQGSRYDPRLSSPSKKIPMTSRQPLVWEKVNFPADVRKYII